MSQILFFHVPKAAGTSVRHYLLDAHPNKKHIQIERDAAWEKMTDEELSSYEIITGHLGWRITQRIPQSTRITFLRDPFERALSMYLFWKNNLKQDKPYMRSFKAFLEMADNHAEIRGVLANGQAWQFYYDWPIAQREAKMPIDDEALLAGALEHLSTFDFIGFQETLDDDLTTMASHFNWPAPTQVYRANKTLNKPSKVGFHPETPGMVREMCAVDYELLERVRGIHVQTNAPISALTSSS